MKSVVTAVEKYRELVFDTHKYIWENPESGYREVKTSRYMENIFKKLGYELVTAGNIPGFYTVLDTGRPGPEIMVLGELDALICAAHPQSDSSTGAVHCCGHSAQCAALVGVAAALREQGALDKMCGKIRLCAVPAEEMIELDYRNKLREKGIIKYFGGKTEFLSRGYFDGVDAAFMVHTSASGGFEVDKGGVGFIEKEIIYHGVSAHAGDAPWKGCNALYAANLGLNAVNAIRETFQEKDIIRVHPIITSGGSVVNAIPDLIRLECQVRGSSFDAINNANHKTNRALCGAALSLGANIEIRDIPGYAPYVNDTKMIELAREALAIAVPGEVLEETGVIAAGSTDMGDLSCVMPIIHPYIPGAGGICHGDNYRIIDKETAIIKSAKWQLVMLRLLLGDNARKARDIIEGYNAPFESKESYLSYLDSLYDEGERICYNNKASAEVRL